MKGNVSTLLCNTAQTPAQYSCQHSSHMLVLQHAQMSSAQLTASVHGQHSLKHACPARPHACPPSTAIPSPSSSAAAANSRSSNTRVMASSTRKPPVLRAAAEAGTPQRHVVCGRHARAGRAGGTGSYHACFMPALMQRNTPPHSLVSGTKWTKPQAGCSWQNMNVTVFTTSSDARTP